MHIGISHRLIKALLARLILRRQAGGKGLIRINDRPERCFLVSCDVSGMYLANSASAQ
ncbi:hypothetical protein D3C81_2336080 [compost metagenome]